MGISPERKEYIYQYAKEKLKRIPLDVPKATYEEIKAHAASNGQSVNGFIKQAISEMMDRDGSGTAPEIAGTRPESAQEAGVVSLPPDALEAAQRAAEAAGEAVGKFLARAVETQANQDRSSMAMGINPTTGDKLEKEA